MTINIEKSFRYLFVLLCAVAAIAICVYWIYKYRLDEDLSVITYREFYEREEDVHPTVSLCLRNPFFSEPLAEYGVNKSSYSDFLRGKYFSTQMLGINYENVTIDISDYIKGYMNTYRNGSIIYDLELKMEKKKTLTHVSFNGVKERAFYKCFAMNIAKVRGILKSRILLSNNIFPNGKRPTNAAFRAVYHLSGQFMLAGQNQKWEWPYRAANDGYKMRVLIGSNTIMRKRNKQKSRCVESDVKYDDWVMKVYTDRFQCNVPYMEKNKMIPICNNQKLMEQGLFSDWIVEKKNLDKPCKTMTGINVEHVETKMDSLKGDPIGSFWLDITFQQPTFIEIEQIR